MEGLLDLALRSSTLMHTVCSLQSTVQFDSKVP